MTNPWLCLLLGVPATGVSLLWLLHAWNRVRTWTRVEATVVSVKEGTAPDKTPQTNLKYRFVDASGQTHIGIDHPIFRTPRRGSTIRARYNPDSPELNETLSGNLVLNVLVVASAAFGIWALFQAYSAFTG